MGAGRPGVSTGHGPLTLYQSLGGDRRRGGGTTRAGSTTRLTKIEKAEVAAELNAEFAELLTLHRVDFPPAEPPVAPSPGPVDEVEIRRRHKKGAVAGIGLLRFRRRSEAKAAAAAAAEEEIEAERARLEEVRGQEQAELDRLWERLVANDADVVLETLEEAFDDNEAPAAAVGIDGDAVTVVILAPPIEAVPERYPTVTEAGNLSLRKLNRTDSAGVYKEVVAGHVLRTLRELFAVAPGVREANVIVVRRPAGSTTASPTDVVLAGSFARSSLQQVDWHRESAWPIVWRSAGDLVVEETGRTKDLEPLDLYDETDLAELVCGIDLEDVDMA